jgi:hypothetical protein
MRMKVLGLLALGMLVGSLAARADEPAATKSRSSCCQKAKANACSPEAKAPETCCPCERANAKPAACGAAKGDPACCKTSAACVPAQAPRVEATMSDCAHKKASSSCCPPKETSCQSHGEAKPACEGGCTKAKAACCQAKTVKK